MWSSFFYIGITYAVFKVERKVPIEKDILAIKDIDSLSVVLKSFKNLRGMLDGPIDLFFTLVTDNFLSICWFFKEGVFVWVA